MSTRRERARLARPMFLVLLAVAWLPCASSSAATGDAKADELAGRALDAMGGQEAWEATRFIRFNFFGFRLHHWDRHTGGHRLEGKTRDGDAYLVLHNINTREGRAWLNGEELDGEDKGKWLEQAYGAWINDTYWLVMPYKLRDPGVNLSYDGEETFDGTPYDKLKLTFEGVGLTPGDTYWAYLNRETGLMERWAYSLESYEEGREPTHWQWLDWERHGGILLSSRRVKVDDGNERMLAEIQVFDQLSESVFSSPEAVPGE